MARLFTCGFEENNLTQTMWTTTSGSNFSIATDRVHSGSRALRFTGGGTFDNYVGRSITAAPSSGNSLWVRAYIEFGTLPNVDTPFLQQLIPASTSAWAIQRNSSSRLVLVNGKTSTTSVGSVATLAVDTQYRLEVRWLRHASTGELEVRLYENDDLTPLETLTLTSQDTDVAATQTRFRYGITGGGSAWFDDIAINNNAGSFQTSWPGPGKIALVRPVSDHAPAGHREFFPSIGATPGTSDPFSFSVPDAVYNGTVPINAFLVGAGGSGRYSTTTGNFSGGGGGGAGFAYNNLDLTGVSTVTVYVGVGGAQRSGTTQNGQTGGSTRLEYPKGPTRIVTAEGGGGGVSGGGTGGLAYTNFDSIVGSYGGNGGAGDNGISINGMGGGGGAGGYGSGGVHGGAGGTNTSTGGNASSSTGAGGGGASTSSPGTNTRGGNGGGVGILGQGSDGAGGAFAGADGSPGSSGSAMLYGGGSGGANGSAAAGQAGSGAVRLIWGSGRSYPSTNTGNVTWSQGGSSIALSSWDGIDDVPGTPNDGTNYNFSSENTSFERFGISTLPSEITNGVSFKVLDVYGRLQAAAGSNTLIFRVWNESGTSADGPSIALSTSWSIVTSAEHQVVDISAKTKANVQAHNIGYKGNSGADEKRVTALWANIEWIEPAVTVVDLTCTIDTLIAPPAVEERTCTIDTLVKKARTLTCTIDTTVLQTKFDENLISVEIDPERRYAVVLED